jgi:hypothetical protein
MSAPSITFLARNNGTGIKGSIRYTVAAAATAIASGDLVAKTLGNTTGNVVTQAATNWPVVGTGYVAGIAQNASNQTASVAGVVDVASVSSNDVLLCAPNVAATWNTQAKYDALVGARVLLDLTAGAFTVLATDSANNGCVVMPIDISKYPGLVAFCIRDGANYLA